MSPCLIRTGGKRKKKKRWRAEEGIAWWKTQMTYQISLMNWSIYWNKLNWCKGSQRSRKLFGYGWKRSRCRGSFQQPGLFVLRVRLVKMCWQPLFIPLNKSMLCVPALLCVCVLFCFVVFFISLLKCLLINLGQKEEQMQLFKWMNLITFAHCTRGAFSSGWMAKLSLFGPAVSCYHLAAKGIRYPYGGADCELRWRTAWANGGHDCAAASSSRSICRGTIRKSRAGDFGASQGCVKVPFFVLFWVFF